jgi:hypothetical protein
MKTLRILVWALFFLISGASNAAITIQATRATVDRLIAANDDFDVGHNGGYNEGIGETRRSMLGRAVFGLATNQDDFASGTGVAKILNQPMRFFGDDSYSHNIALDGDNFLRRKYAVILGILPDGSSALTREINMRGPEPDEWAVIVLGIGFVIYLMRPRQTRQAANLTSNV